jgi:UDP-N-acetylmuramoyl-L-alanyl-D-glutamate--2,6-diaminopimelate ligase
VVKSPGIPFDAPLIRRALELRLEVLDELELGWRLSRAPVIAVTGTNGKSTVCSLLSAIASAAGLNAPVAGNSQFAPPLSALAATSADLIVCEASSFQLEGCGAMLPEAAVLTNIRPEHLNRHGTFDAYAACKRRLFIRGDGAIRLAALNLDEDHGVELAEEVRARGGTAVGYGQAAAAEFRLRRCGWSLTSGWLEVDTPDGAISLRTKLPGPHNAANVAGALAVACSLGFELETIVGAIERTPGVQGRFERIDEGQPFDVIVDFAHTPDAVSAVIGAALPVVRGRPGARLNVLVSVSGHRSRELSAPIGQTAARLADRVVLTAGSSFGQPHGELLAPLIEGARSERCAAIEIVPNRRAAIRRVLALASSRDVVLVLGRGAIPRLSRHANGAGIAFDDRIVVRDELRGLLRRAE